MEFTLVRNVGDYTDIGPWDFTFVVANNIAEKRQRILDLAGFEKLVMLDDDLTIYERVGDRKFQRATAGGVKRLFEEIEKQLEDYAQVGVNDRFMSHATVRLWRVGGRYNQILAYNPKLFPVPKPKFFAGMYVNEEHDFNLQLLSHGLPALILTEWTKADASYAQGGCQLWRSAAIELAGHHMLAARHPDFVKVVDSPSSLSGKRIQVKWKKALEAGRE
jgi:hypothetical protein